MNILTHQEVEVPAPGPKPVPAFRFSGKEGRLLGTGAMNILPGGRADTLEARLSHHFAQHGPQTVIAGAFPFDRNREDHFLSMAQTVPLSGQEPLPPLVGTFHAQAPDPAPAQFYHSVEQALARLQAEARTEGGLRKVVLARSFLAGCDRPIAPEALFAALSGDPAVTAFQMPLPDRKGKARALVGATPELLIAKQGSRIRSHPLAGSAPRRSDLATDAQVAAQLSRSAKDWHEHRFLVEYILDTLAPHCETLSLPEGTSLASTRTMWHLGTWIEGSLRDPDMPGALLAAALHPTPAVCGVPHAPAMDLISRLEPVDRDFYAGAVGWCDGCGDGAWYVAIRCAEICGCQARLHAGAGIVPDSDPLSETEETGAKFRAMLLALGLPDDAGREGIDQLERQARSRPNSFSFQMDMT